MAHIAQPSGHFSLSDAPHALSAALSRVFARVLGILTEPRTTLADRDIDRFVQRSGGRLTDALEREIAERTMTRSFGR
jgi:hypothetical protein